MVATDRQRVAVARALLSRPEIVFADEPTGNLDSTATSEILNVLCRLNVAGRTVILITHEHEVVTAAKRVITLRDGRIVQDSRQGTVSGLPPGFVPGGVTRTRATASDG